MDLENDI